MTLADIQEHTLQRDLGLPARAKALTTELRAALVKASNAGTLLTAPHDIHQIVRTLAEPPPNVATQLTELDLSSNAYCIVGGEKNQGRDSALSHLLRDDGAWFDFSIVVRELKERLDLLAYDFEIRFPPGMGVPFMRYDLNFPSHRNEDRDLRSHLHVGSDDILTPSPLMSPAELVALFVDGLRFPPKRKRRDPTAFEVDWIKGTHKLVVGDGDR